MSKGIIKRLLIFFMFCLLAAVQPAGLVLPSAGGTLIVAEASEKKVSLNKKTVSLSVAGKATVQLRNINSKKKIVWSSSNKNVAAVKKGTGGKAAITGKKAGTAVITAKYRGKKYTVKVTVKSPSLNKKSLSLKAGKKSTLQLKNIVSSKKITWKSSKPSVVSVKRGSSGKATVTAKKKGTAKITAYYNGKKYTCTVSVKAAAPKLNVKSKTLLEGKSFNLELQNVSSSVKWTTSNKKVASIKKISKYKYKVTAKKAGKATITAKAGNKKYTCTVTVKANTTDRGNGNNGTASSISNYTYSITVLNRYNLYNSSPVIVYIKTNNPNPDSLSVNFEKGGTTTCILERYEDVKYYDKAYFEENGTVFVSIPIFSKVSGGYLTTVSTESVGSNTLLIREGGRTVARKSLFLNNWKEAEKSWLKKIIAQETNNSMTPEAKMSALASYVQRNFQYTPNKGGKVCSLVSKTGIYFESYVADCIGATSIMCKFADLLGLKSESTYAGYLNHYYATVWIDGKSHIYDASPYGESGAISKIDYVL